MGKCKTMEKKKGKKEVKAREENIKITRKKKGTKENKGR